jgi:hypothetical protein
MGFTKQNSKKASVYVNSQCLKLEKQFTKGFADTCHLKLGTFIAIKQKQRLILEYEAVRCLPNDR